MLAQRRSFLILSLALFLGLGAALPWLLAPWLPEILKAAGFKRVELVVEETGWTQLSLKDVRLDDTISAKRLSIGFSLFGLSSIDAVNLTLKAGTDGQSLTLGHMTIPFSSKGSGPVLGLPRIRLDRAKLDLATDMGAVQALVSAEPGDGSTKIRIDLASIDKVERFSSLVLTGIVTEDGPLLRFAGRLNDSAHRLTLNLQGRHDQLDNSGEANLILERIDFTPSGLQPESLLPQAVAYIQNVSGPLEGDMRFVWQKGKLESSATIGLHGLSFEAKGAKVRNLMGTLSLDRVWPLRTPAHQNFSVGMLTAGVPLGSGSFSFSIEEDGAISIKRASLNLAEGKLRLDPTRIAPDMTGRLDFQAKGINLEHLAPLMGIEGIALDGIVDGTIPVILDKTGVKVAKANLVTSKPGYVRYRPKAVPDALQAGGEGVSLMLAALKDFRFDDLTLELDGQAGGETTVFFHVKGRNPGLHNGVPFELNFRLTGPLDRLAQQAWGIVSLPETFEAIPHDQIKP
ncbi:MAG: YdbH domain-containing protein [Alphaproteobacteria bacterium]|nr:YdbH domain-containing protein [Alphaproteobacteria bacterium]